MIQELFYDGPCSHEDYIRTIIGDVRTLMGDFNVTYIHASYQMDEVHHWAQSTPHDKQALERVTEYHTRLLEFMPEFFLPLIEDLKQCIEYMKRYLLSFFHGKRDAYVETGVHYDMKRRELERVMNIHMKNITNMGTAYRQKRGLNVKMFGFGTNELARKCDVGDLPVLLVFPEACSNIKNACEAIEQWVKADEQYPEFVKMDILDLEHKRDNQTRNLRENSHHLFHCEHKVKSLQKDINDLENDMVRLRHRDVQLNKQIQELEHDKHDMKLDIEIKEQQRDALRYAHPLDHDTISKLANEISELRFNLPDMDRKMEAVRHKMLLLTQRKELLDTKTAELHNRQQELTKHKKNVQDAKQELNRIEDAITLLKEIYSRKTSDDVTKKIFHDLPVEPRNARLLPSKPSPRHNIQPSKKLKPVKKKKGKSMLLQYRVIIQFIL